jgi:hypothetical protein
MVAKIQGVQRDCSITSSERRQRTDVIIATIAEPASLILPAYVRKRGGKRALKLGMHRSGKSSVEEAEVLSRS